MHKFLLLFFLVPSIGLAANWKLVDARSATGMRIDLDSIVQTKPGDRKAWVEFTYGVPEEIEPGKFIQKTMTLDHYDCSERMIGTVQMNMYADIEGEKPVYSHSISREKIVFRNVEPDSVHEVAMKFICERPLTK